MKRGLGRTFQINTLFRGLPVLDNVALGVAERAGIAGRLWRAASAFREVRDEALELLATLGLADDARDARRSICPTASSAWSRSRSRSASSPRCCSSTSRRRACRRPSPSASCEVLDSAARGDRHPDHRARHGSRVPLRAADHRPGAGRGPGAKARRRRSRPTGACTRSISASAACADALPAERRARRLRRDRRARGHRVRLARARLARGARPQRRRQDHAARDRDRAHHVPLPARSSTAARRSRGCRPTSAARLGIGYVPQEREIFPSLTVEENLTVAARPGPLEPRARLRALSRASRERRSPWATRSRAASSRCSRSAAR